MKQILTLLLLLCSMTAAAQDIIVKKDGTAVQAIVTEVLSSDVKYKKFSNPNGPTYTIAIADLISITYENGDVDRFNTPTPTKEEPAAPVVTRQQEPSAPVATQQQEPSTNYEYIPDGRRTKSDAELLQIYQIDHPVFIKGPVDKTSTLYQKGKKMKTAGWIIGSSLFVAGIVFFSVDQYNYPFDTGYNIAESILPLSIPGLIIGGTLIGIGNKKINKSRTIQTATVFQQEFPLGKHSTLAANVNLMKDSYRNQYAPALGFHINF